MESSMESPSTSESLVGALLLTTMRTVGMQPERRQLSGFGDLGTRAKTNF